MRDQTKARLEGRRWVGFLLRAVAFLLGVMFILSARQKLLEPDLFVTVVHEYGVLPLALEAPLAAVLPWLEIGIGLLLLTGLFPVQVSLAGSALLAVFAAAMAFVLLQQRVIECGCGFFSGQVSILSILRNLVLIALLLCIYLWRRGSPRSLRRCLYRTTTGTGSACGEPAKPARYRQ